MRILTDHHINVYNKSMRHVLFFFLSRKSDLIWYYSFPSNALCSYEYVREEPVWKLQQCRLMLSVASFRGLCGLASETWDLNKQHGGSVSLWFSHHEDKKKSGYHPQTVCNRFDLQVWLSFMIIHYLLLQLGRILPGPFVIILTFSAAFSNFESIQEFELYLLCRGQTTRSFRLLGLSLCWIWQTQCYKFVLRLGW